MNQAAERAMSQAAAPAAAGAGAAGGPAAKRLRRCGWIGVIGLLAGLPLVFAMMSGGRFDALAFAAVAGWLIVAWLTQRCFATSRALARGNADPRPGRLKWLAVAAFLFPGLPIMALTPWALLAGFGRAAQNTDPRELVLAGWGVLGLVYFFVLIRILLTARMLGRRDGGL